jgi:hypothetical protein
MLGWTYLAGFPKHCVFGGGRDYKTMDEDGKLVNPNMKFILHIVIAVER